RPSPSPRSRTGSPCAPSSGSSASAAKTSSGKLSARFRREGRGRRPSDGVKQAATPKLAACATLAALGLLAALVFGRAGLAVLAAPFLAIVVAGLAVARKPSIHVMLEAERDRVLEGDTLRLEIALESSGAVEALDVFVAVAPELEPIGEARNPYSTRLVAHRPLRREVLVRCARWARFASRPSSSAREIASASSSTSRRS